MNKNERLKHLISVLEQAHKLAKRPMESQREAGRIISEHVDVLIEDILYDGHAEDARLPDL